MSRKPTSKRTRPEPKQFFAYPDLDQAKSAVLNSLTSALNDGRANRNLYPGLARARVGNEVGTCHLKLFGLATLNLTDLFEQSTSDLISMRGNAYARFGWCR